MSGRESNGFVTVSREWLFVTLVNRNQCTVSEVRWKVTMLTMGVKSAARDSLRIELAKTK